MLYDIYQCSSVPSNALDYKFNFALIVNGVLLDPIDSNAIIVNTITEKELPYKIGQIGDTDIFLNS